MTEPIFELAVRQVKPDRMSDFSVARKAFIDKWRTQPGVTADREFEALLTLPTPLDGVFVGMTAWESAVDYENASKAFWGGLELTAFMDTVTLPAFALLTQTEGDPIDLSTLAAKPGQVLEIAVRRPKGVTVQAFDLARKGFVKVLADQPGVLAAYEFAIQGEPVDGARVGMTVYASKAEWQGAMKSSAASPAGPAFFAVIEPTIIAYVESI